MEPWFLSVDDVLVMHEDTLRHEGGLGGVRDLNLLDAAVAMPRQQFAGQYLHEDLPAMGAAYLFHLAQNHPFHDGNKRVAALACLVFLDSNGVKRLPPARDLERVTMSVADGKLAKTEVMDWLREQVGARG